MVPRHSATALVPAAVLALEKLLEHSTTKRVVLLGTAWGVIILAGEPMIGIGTALLERLETEAEKLGVKTIFADVSVTAKVFFLIRRDCSARYQL